MLVQRWLVAWKHTFSKLLLVPGLLETEFAPPPLARKFCLSSHNLAGAGARQPGGSWLRPLVTHTRPRTPDSEKKPTGFLLKVTPESRGTQTARQISPGGKHCGVARMKEDALGRAVNREHLLASAVLQEITLQNRAAALSKVMW